MHKFYGRENNPLSEGKLHPAHCRGRLPGFQVLREIPGTDRSILNPESGPLSDLVGGDARGSQLWHDDGPVPDDGHEPGISYPFDELIGAKRPLPRRTPDIDPPGIQDKKVGIDPGEG